MKQPARKESALDRKLRALNEQTAALQGDIRNLDKSLQKYVAPKSDPAVRAALLERARTTISRHNPNYAASIGTGTNTSITITDQDPQPAANEADVNVFTVETAAPAATPPPEVFATTRSDTDAPAARVRRVVEAKPEKLKNYLSSGSFGSNVPLGRERSAQKVRALFALTAALTFGYIIYRALFR